MVFVTSVKFICNNPGFYKYYVTIETKLALYIIVFVLIQKKQDKQLFVISDKDGHSERRGINKLG